MTEKAIFRSSVLRLLRATTRAVAKFVAQSKSSGFFGLGEKLWCQKVVSGGEQNSLILVHYWRMDRLQAFYETLEYRESSAILKNTSQGLVDNSFSSSGACSTNVSDIPGKRANISVRRVGIHLDHSNRRKRSTKIR